jgi:hypothetical protein
MHVLHVCSHSSKLKGNERNKEQVHESKRGTTQEVEGEGKRAGDKKVLQKG